nr:MAG TPA: hypothetical protein [Caudoviricetes sp.]
MSKNKYKDANLRCNTRVIDLDESIYLLKSYDNGQSASSHN